MLARSRCPCPRETTPQAVEVEVGVAAGADIKVSNLLYRAVESINEGPIYPIQFTKIVITLLSILLYTYFPTHNSLLGRKPNFYNFYLKICSTIFLFAH